jgi:hypothetical protein
MKEGVAQSTQDRSELYAPGVVFPVEEFIDVIEILFNP